MRCGFDHRHTRWHSNRLAETFSFFFLIVEMKRQMTSNVAARVFVFDQLHQSVEETLTTSCDDTVAGRQQQRAQFSEGTKNDASNSESQNTKRTEQHGVRSRGEGGSCSSDKRSQQRRFVFGVEELQ